MVPRAFKSYEDEVHWDGEIYRIDFRKLQEVCNIT